MADYTKSTNFTAKDSLPSGNSGKIIKGAEIDTEFTAIASAISSKADINSPALTGTPTAPTASSTTNTTQLATTAFVQTALASAFSTGMIMMWSGSIATIPTGWALCNGSNGTPDLRNRFVIGAHSDNAGVANTTVTGTSTQTGGSKDAIAVSHSHTLSAAGSAASAGTHQHFAVTNGMFGGEGGLSASTYIGRRSAWNSDFSYDFGNTGSEANIGLTSNAGAHTHALSGSTDAAGSSGTNANLPPYYALAFIMKT